MHIVYVQIKSTVTKPPEKPRNTQRRYGVDLLEAKSTKNLNKVSRAFYFMDFTILMIRHDCAENWVYRGLREGVKTEPVCCLRCAFREFDCSKSQRPGRHHD